MSGIRMKMGVDVWECECGEIVAIGKYCPKCGASYAEQLEEQYAPKERKTKPKKTKFREPRSSGKFTTSYMFRRNEPQ